METNDNYTGVITIKDPLIEPYYISRDRYTYVVYEVVNSTESNKTYEVIVGYYPTLGKCLQAIAKGMRFFRDKYPSIAEYIKQWKEQEERINKLINIEL